MNNAPRGTLLQVVAMGTLASPAPGPAIQGRHDWAIVAAVSTQDGTPLGGLTSANFTVSLLAIGVQKARAGTAELADVREVMSGVYVLFLDRAGRELFSAPATCVIDVSASAGAGGGSAHGRTLGQFQWQ